jgi:hypothetical protein
MGLLRILLSEIPQESFARQHEHTDTRGCKALSGSLSALGHFRTWARALRGRLYPDEPTSSGSFGRSEKCHMRIWVKA